MTTKCSCGSRIEGLTMRAFIVMTAFLFHLVGAEAQSNPGAAIPPTKLVSDLYRAHRAKSDPLQAPASRKLLAAYFDKGLLSLFLRDQAESKGEIGKLDFDPLYNAQDLEIGDFSVALVTQEKNSAQVTASFRNMGKKEKIVFLLSATNQGWRISDIKYSNGHTLKGILK